MKLTFFIVCLLLKVTKYGKFQQISSIFKCSFLSSKCSITYIFILLRCNKSIFYCLAPTFTNFYTTFTNFFHRLPLYTNFFNLPPTFILVFTNYLPSFISFILLFINQKRICFFFHLLTSTSPTYC